MSVPLKNLRIIPREEEFLNRKSGLRGEIFFNENTGSLRLYNGTSGGTEVALNTLSNVANAVFLNKAISPSWIILFIEFPIILQAKLSADNLVLSDIGINSFEDKS